MKYREFGANNKEIILLLHGGGLSWWNYRDQARLLSDRFRVILPILDGHAGSDRSFTSIRNNAVEIIDFIDRELGGSVALIGGLSLGGQILLEMLSLRSGLCRHALVESAAVIPSPLTRALIGPAFGSSYGLIRDRRFAALQFKSLHIRPELFEDYYRDSCQIEKADMIAFLKASAAYTLPDAVRGCGAKIHVLAGAKENREILRSAEKIGGAVGVRVEFLPGLYHGEFSLNRPEAYAEMLGALLGGQ